MNGTRTTGCVARNERYMESDINGRGSTAPARASKQSVLLLRESDPGSRGSRPLHSLGQASRQGDRKPRRRRPTLQSRQARLSRRRGSRPALEGRKVRAKHFGSRSDCRTGLVGSCVWRIADSGEISNSPHTRPGSAETIALVAYAGSPELPQHQVPAHKQVRRRGWGSFYFPWSRDRRSRYIPIWMRVAQPLMQR